MKILCLGFSHNQWLLSMYFTNFFFVLVLLSLWFVKSGVYFSSLYSMKIPNVVCLCVFGYIWVCVSVSFLINLCYRVQCNKLYFGINIHSHYFFPCLPHVLIHDLCLPLTVHFFFSQIAIPSFSISQSIP